MGQVSRLQTRIMTQPMATSGPVPKPNSSAPSRAAMATSRPLISLLSASECGRWLRRPFMIRRLVGLGNAQLPRQTCVVDGVAGGCARAAVKAGNQDDLRTGLGNARGNRADTGLADELDVDGCLAVGASSNRRSAAPGPRSSKYRGGAGERSGRRRWSSCGSWRPTGRPCRRAAGRPRRASRPAPS